MTEFTAEWIKQWRFLNTPIKDTFCLSALVFSEALDHIERLQKYKEKLISDATQNEFVLLAYHDSLKEMIARVQELEIHNKDFHLACINALDLHRESDVPKLKDIPNIIEELRTRVQELEQERRWIPVSERLPEEGQLVLIDFGNNEITVGIWFWENEPEEWYPGTDYAGWKHWNYGWDKFEPSDEPPLHWQPLPKPPSEEE